MRDARRRGFVPQGRESRRLASARVSTDLNVARPSFRFDAGSAATDARAQFVLAPLLNHHGNAGLDLAGIRVGVEAETCAGWHGAGDAAGASMELPIAVGRGVTLNGQVTGTRFSAQVGRCAANRDAATAGPCGDAATGLGNGDAARARDGADLAPDLAQGDAA